MCRRPIVIVLLVSSEVLAAASGLRCHFAPSSAPSREGAGHVKVSYFSLLVMMLILFHSSLQMKHQQPGSSGMLNGDGSEFLVEPDTACSTNYVGASSAAETSYQCNVTQ